MATLHAVLAAAEEAETSKTVFYVLGGGLAIWGVLLGFAGLRRAAFPTGATGARAVMAISALLAVAAMASAALTG